MTEIKGRTVFITGGASGIGLGMAKAFHNAGANLVIADIRDDHLQTAANELGSDRTHFIKLDVTNRDAWVKAADEAEAKFGNVHILCNNAGVGPFGDATVVSYADWDWCNSVTYGGVINGVQTFLNRMIAHGEGGHIINTTSCAGLLPMAGGIAYMAAKFAVTGLTEALRSDLMGKDIKVTLLVPGPIKSNIHQAALLRPEEHKNTKVGEMEKDMLNREAPPTWMEPEYAGRLIVDGIARDLPYIITHGQFKAGVQQYHDALEAYFPEVSEEDAKLDLGFKPINPVFGEILANLKPTAKA